MVDDYKIFHDKSSLTFENCDEFSEIASWIVRMKDFSTKLDLDIPSSWKLAYDLSSFNKKTKLHIEELLKSRRSVRKFSTQKISMEDFAFILNNSLGVSCISEKEYHYPYPSSGGIEFLIPIICVTNVKDVSSGIYYYDAKRYKLFKISEFEKMDYNMLSSSTSLARQSAFSIHLFVSGDQKCYKYQDRGYRFLLLECGHIMQNVHLCSTSLKLGCVMSGGGYDKVYLNSLEYLNSFGDIMVLYECFLGELDNK